MIIYFGNWGFESNFSKTEISTIHLHNRLADNKLNTILEHNFPLKYFGVTLDKSLSFRSHLAELQRRINIINIVADTSSGSDVSALVCSTADYCAPV